LTLSLVSGKLADSVIDLKKIPKTEFASAVAQIAGERNIDIQVVIDSVQSAILAAFKRDAREREEEIDEEAEYRVLLDPETGETKILHMVDEKEVDVTPPGFGRIAAQTAKQVILQKIREAEKEVLISQFKNRVGTLVTGVVLRIEGPQVVVSLGKAEAVMPKEERVRNEHYHSSQRLAFYLKEIREEEENKVIIVSRAAPELVVELFRREVPEVSSGAVEVRRIARRSGERTKIAVFSNRPGIDPVGSCVGQKGVRVQAVIRELNDEKVDVIPFSENLNQFIRSALSPADDVEIAEIDKETRRVVVAVANDQLAMAIGDGGENVGLAGEITDCEIKVVGKKEPVEKEKVDKEKVSKKEKESREKPSEKEKVDNKKVSKKEKKAKKDTVGKEEDNSSDPV